MASLLGLADPVTQPMWLGCLGWSSPLLGAGFPMLRVEQNSACCRVSYPNLSLRCHLPLFYKLCQGADALFVSGKEAVS